VFYSIHVRRKTGEWQSELRIRQGKLPHPGAKIWTILHGETVTARVMVLVTNPSPAKDHPAIEVRAEEI
jgi:hypothetical protein